MDFTRRSCVAMGKTTYATLSSVRLVKELGHAYRVFAVDSIGDVGKSVLNNLTKPLAGGEEIGRFHTDVTHKLGFDKSCLAGASIGGYISTLYALHAPERVKKLVLLGSMGYGDVSVRHETA